MSRRKIPLAEWTRGTKCRGRVGRGVLDQPFGCWKSASLGYFSLHEQREVTRSCEAGAKALLSSFRFHAWPLPWPLPWSLPWSLAWSFDCRVGTDVQGEARARAETGSKAFAPLRGASHLSLLVQRNVAQRNTPLPTRPPCCALRVHSAAGIFRHDIPVVSKNDVRPCTSPLRGLVRRLRRCRRGYEVKSSGAKAQARARAEKLLQ